MNAESDRRITRDDVRAGRVAPKPIENGVMVPPALQINTLTVEEHQARLRMLGQPPLSAAEIERIHGPRAKGTGPMMGKN